MNMQRIVDFVNICKQKNRISNRSEVLLIKREAVDPEVTKSCQRRFTKDIKVVYQQYYIVLGKVCSKSDL